MEFTEHKKYKLSLKFINNIAAGRSTYSSLTKLGHAYIQKLYYQTQETVHLGVLSDVKVLYIDKIDSNHTLRMHSYIGYQANVYCTGIGKALLAWLSPQVLNEIIPRIEFKEYTETTITDATEFEKHLAKIKKQGYSVDNEEHEKYLYCLAVPIFDMRDHPVAAVSVSQPIIRFDKADKEPYLAMLWECAKDISIQLGNQHYEACLGGKM